MIWKLICIFLSFDVSFRRLNIFVYVVRKLSIQYFNKIKLNYFAKDVLLIYIFLLHIMEKHWIVNILYVALVMFDYLSFILSAGMEAGEVGSWHPIILSLFLFVNSKIPHMCKTLWQGEMFAVAVATWCNPTWDPVQTRHQGIPPLADATVQCVATGKLSGTTIIQ